MPHKVTLLSLKESADREAVAKEILKLPHLTRGVVLNKLGKLPWELPEVSDALEENHWSEGLKNLGCELEVVPVVEGGDIESADYWPSEGLGEEEAEGRSSWEITRKEEGKRPASEEIPATPRAARRFGRLRSLWWVLPVLLLFLVLGIWRFKGEENSPGRITGDWNRRMESGSQAKREAPSKARPGSPPAATSKYRRAPPPKWNISQVKNILRRDPANTYAWSSWIDTLESSGHWEKANVVRRLYMAKSGKVKKDLDSLAGGRGFSIGNHKLTPGELRLSVGLPPEGSVDNPLQRGYFFYKELRKLHGDKRITAEVQASNSDSYFFSVPRSRESLTWEQFKEHLRM